MSHLQLPKLTSSHKSLFKSRNEHSYTNITLKYCFKIILVVGSEPMVCIDKVYRQINCFFYLFTQVKGDLTKL